MANCGQACPYNTLNGCKVKEYNAICPLSNMATPITKYQMTNADRIRAMSDEELVVLIRCGICAYIRNEERCNFGDCLDCIREWLKQPAEVEK